jgi:hypothetical protein
MKLQPKYLNRLNDPGLLEVRQHWLERLEALFNEQPLEGVFQLQGISKYTEQANLDWRSWLEQSLAELAGEVERARDRRVFRPLIVNFNPCGVHFVDRFFGADVFQMEDQSWQVYPLEREIGQLEPPDLERLPEWQVMKDVAEAFLEYRVEGLTFALPTIASTLNIAINLYGQSILEAMHTAPEAVRHDFRVINEVLCGLHRWYLGHLPLEKMQCIVPDGRYQPAGYGQLCGCSTQLLSASMYKDFVSAFDDALLSVYPKGGMIHLCGDHDQHIPAWRAMPSLRAVQVNDRAAEDLGRYFDELRPDQIFYANPCPGMPVSRILEITGGRRLVLVTDEEIHYET